MPGCRSAGVPERRGLTAKRKLFCFSYLEERKPFLAVKSSSFGVGAGDIGGGGAYISKIIKPLALGLYNL